MATNNPTWGEERIADELLLKIGVQISPRTIRRYIPKPCRPQKFRPTRIPFPQRVCAILSHVASFSRLSVPQQYFLRLCGCASLRVPRPTNIVGTRCRESVSAQTTRAIR